MDVYADDLKEYERFGDITSPKGAAEEDDDL